MKLNTFQAAVALTYGGGDYAHLVETGVEPRDLSQLGDTLFKFLMLELADQGYGRTMDAATAVQRMTTALADVRHAFDVVVQVQQTKG